MLKIVHADFMYGKWINGIRILTTEPSDHADDDSLECQIMRFIKGFRQKKRLMISFDNPETASGKKQSAMKRKVSVEAQFADDVYCAVKVSWPAVGQSWWLDSR
jgi:hypothetical protein